jgi:hypothetical protein
VSINGSGCRARQRTDALVDGFLGERAQLIVRGRISEVAFVSVSECITHSLRPHCPRSVMGWLH